MDWCDQCRGVHVPAWHYPQWRVWCRSWGDGEQDGRLVRAKDPAHAAERWAETEDAYGDYAIIAVGHADAVVVQSPDGDAVYVFDVSAEAQIVYNAVLLEGE